MMRSIYRAVAIREHLRRRFTFRGLLGLGSAVLLLCPTSQGAIIEMEMTGTITTVTDSLGLLPFAHVNDEVVYRFSYDSEAPDTNGFPNSAIYLGIGASLRAGNQMLVSDTPTIEIVHPNDWFEVNSHLANTGLSNDLSNGFVYFRLLDQAESNALPDTQLPLTPYDLDAFFATSFQVTFFGPPVTPGGTDNVPVFFYGDIDSFSLIPEPLSILMLFPALALLRRSARVAFSS